MLFCLVIQPLLDSLVELVQVKLEAEKAKYAVQVTKMNKEVRDLQKPEEEISTHVIGFRMPDDEEEELEEDDDF
jgi:hypothetical protein